MPTATMTMTQAMRSPDICASCPAVSGQREGSDRGLAMPPSKNLCSRGWENKTQLLPTPLVDLSLLLSMDLEWRESHPLQNV